MIMLQLCTIWKW